jgi:hypothetical protein
LKEKDMAGTPEDQDRKASEQDRPIACKKCGGDMHEGKAIAQTLTGMPDFPGDKSPVTLSAGGPGVLIDCLKCSKCGWSMTVPTLRAPAPGG